MKKIILALILSCCYNHATAWNASGHQIIAAMAWDLLDEKQQNYWSDILKHHPRFEKDFENLKPADVKKKSPQYDEWIFRHAATWPDIVRGLNDQLKDKYHNSSWHYINYPIFIDKKVDTSFLNHSLNYQGKNQKKLNIIQAIKANINIIKKHGATKKQKALAVSWLLHLIGDAHQPLHSSALFSEHYFKRGDRGGNLLKINGQGQIENLHWYWDTRLDNSISFKVIDVKAKKINEKHKKAAEKHQNDNIHKWISHSYVYAKEHVYTETLLNTLKKHEQNQTDQPSINIDNDYDKNARTISEIQAVKAAYKLAYLLKLHNPD